MGSFEGETNLGKAGLPMIEWIHYCNSRTDNYGSKVSWVAADQLAANCVGQPHSVSLVSLRSAWLFLSSPSLSITETETQFNGPNSAPLCFWLFLFSLFPPRAYLGWFKPAITARLVLFFRFFFFWYCSNVE